MKTIFSSFTIDEKDFGKPMSISRTGLVFDQLLGEKVSKVSHSKTPFSPGLVEVIGGNKVVLGEPAGFLDVIVSGQVRQIPFY